MEQPEIRSTTQEAAIFSNGAIASQVDRSKTQWLISSAPLCLAWALELGPALGILSTGNRRKRSRKAGALSTLSQRGAHGLQAGTPGSAGVAARSIPDFRPE